MNVLCKMNMRRIKFRNKAKSQIKTITTVTIITVIKNLIKTNSKKKIQALYFNLIYSNI